MSYYHAKVFDADFDSVVEQVTKSLSDNGFGILTEIDVAATMEKKLDKTMPPYRILGACNPEMAHKALQLESKIGTMLPCNVIVRQHEEGGVEVAAIDPVASMQAVGNEELLSLAGEVGALLRQSLDNVSL